MQTEELRSAFQNLVRLAKTDRTAISCWESLFWRCHRRSVSDHFAPPGGHVEHFFPDRHRLTDTVVVKSENPVTITYLGDLTLFDQ